MARRYVVALHELEREYGGPEEGGWYYDAGIPARELARFTRRFASRAKAARYANRLRREVIPRVSYGRPVWSVAYTGGAFDAVVQRGDAPRAWPAAAPFYC